MDILFELLRYFTMFYKFVENIANAMWLQPFDPDGPYRIYFISENGDYKYDVTYRNIPVPEDAIYIEEWVNADTKRFRVIYGGEDITDFEGDAFAPVKVPWVWIGEKDSEEEYTATFNKFLFPGNVIRRELVEKLMSNKNLKYMDKSLNEHEFPGDGVVIELDEPVSDSGEVHPTQEGVQPTLVD